MRRQRGSTLIEMSLALVILGLLSMLVWQVVGYTVQQRHAAVERGLLARADDAITGFVLARHRLPCADTDGDGREDCAATSGGVPVQAGRLAYRSIGLPDARAARLRYGVLRRPAADAMLDADLAVAQQRFRPLTTTAEMLRPAGDVNALDLCQATRVAAGQGFDPLFLHTSDGSRARQTAYALAAPGALDANGDGNPLDGAQASSASRFELPQRASAPDYDDRVVAVGFDQLWARLRCGEALAAAGHAHYNAAVSAAMLRQSSHDYLKLLQLSEKLADAAVSSAIATQLSAIAGLATATASSLIATAQTLLSYGAMTPVLVAAVAAVASNTAAIVAAGLSVAKANTALTLAREKVAQAQVVVAQADALAPDIANNAKAAIAAGLY